MHNTATVKNPPGRKVNLPAQYFLTLFEYFGVLVSFLCFSIKVFIGVPIPYTQYFVCPPHWGYPSVQTKKGDYQKLRNRHPPFEPSVP